MKYECTARCRSSIHRSSDHHKLPDPYHVNLQSDDESLERLAAHTTSWAPISADRRARPGKLTKGALRTPVPER